MSILELVHRLTAGGVTAVIVKVTLVLIMATGVTIVLRGASAAARHLVWLVALAACMAIAVAAPARVHIDVPIAMLRRQMPPARAVFIDVKRRLARTEAAAIARRSSLYRPTVAALTSVVRARPERRLGWVGNHAVLLMQWVWLAGFLTILARCIVGHRLLSRFVARSRAFESRGWQRSLDAAADEIGVDRPVTLLVSPDVAGPITTGVMRPLILLPAGAEWWTEERRRIVLVHELAHVARFDYAAQVVATISCALFWFHPLVWLAGARLRAEAEHAADDRVLETGTVGVTYATHLLDMARGVMHPQLTPAAVGMVRSSRLEGRFRAMLDANRSRGEVSPAGRIIVAVLALMMVVPLACVRTTLAATRPAARAHTVKFRPAPQPARSVPLMTVHSNAAADSIVDKTVSARQGGLLHLELPTGGDVVLHAWNESRIRLRGRLAGESWRDADVTLETSGAGDDVRLRSRFRSSGGPRSSSFSFELWVPRRTDVELSSAGGSIEIEGLSGRFTGHTGGGSITVTGAEGYASLTTGGGEILVANSNLDGKVSTSGGGVTMENVTGGIHAGDASGVTTFTHSESGTNTHIVGSGHASTTISGQHGSSVSTSGTTTTHTITATAPDYHFSYGSGTHASTGVSTGVGFGYGVGTCNGSTTITTRASTTTITGSGAAYTMSKAGGAITIDEAPNGAALSTGGGRIYVGSSNGIVAANTGGGDIDLRRVGGDAVVSTGAGEVTISVFNEDGTQHSVSVCSGSGGVVLELPRDIDATFELETAYTDSFGGRTRIESDFSLEQSESPSWDTQRGSPRKYVRATGRAGNGGGLIRVQTVNGDIVVRRR